jgi:hypothetical protein
VPELSLGRLVGKINAIKARMRPREKLRGCIDIVNGKLLNAAIDTLEASRRDTRGSCHELQQTLINHLPKPLDNLKAGAAVLVDPRMFDVRLLVYHFSPQRII